MELECGKCGRTVRSRQERLDCASCRITFHRICMSDLTRDEFRRMKKDGSIKLWECKKCSSKDQSKYEDIADMPDVPKTTDTILDVVMETTTTDTVLLEVANCPQETNNRLETVIETNTTDSGLEVPKCPQETNTTDPVLEMVMETNSADPVLEVVIGNNTTDPVLEVPKCPQETNTTDPVLEIVIENNSADPALEVPKKLYQCCIEHGAVEKTNTIEHGAVEKTNTIEHGAVEKTNTSDNMEVKLVKNPFLEEVEVLMKLSPLLDLEAGYAKFEFSITTEQYQKWLAKYSSENDEGYGIYFRMCKNLPGEQSDMLACLSMFVNNRLVSLLSNTDLTKEETLMYKTRQPVNITSACLMQFCSTFSGKTSFKSFKIGAKMRLPDIRDRAKNCVSVSICKKKCVDEVVEEMRSNCVDHPSHTQAMIKGKLASEEDGDICTTSLKASLNCPIGKKRLETPCRGRNCSHLQCIDASTIIGMNESKPKWICPICDQPTKFEDIRIDGLFLEILESVPDSVQEVKFKEDGQWTYKNDKENCISLDDSLNETIEKINIIDLTETDDEGTPLKKKPLGDNTALLNKAYTRPDSNLFKNLTTKTSQLSVPTENSSTSFTNYRTNSTSFTNNRTNSTSFTNNYTNSTGFTNNRTNSTSFTNNRTNSTDSARSHFNSRTNSSSSNSSRHHVIQVTSRNNSSSSSSGYRASHSSTDSSSSYRSAIRPRDNYRRPWHSNHQPYSRQPANNSSNNSTNNWRNYGHSSQHNKRITQYYQPYQSGGHYSSAHNYDDWRSGYNSYYSDTLHNNVGFQSEVTVSRIVF